MEINGIPPFTGGMMHSTPFRHFPPFPGPSQYPFDSSKSECNLRSFNQLWLQYRFRWKIIGAYTDRHSYSYICINVFWSIPSRLEAAGIVMVVWFPNPASLTAANSSSVSCRGRHIIFSRCETDSSVASPLYVSRYDSNIPLPPPWTLNV